MSARGHAGSCLLVVGLALLLRDDEVLSGPRSSCGSRAFSVLGNERVSQLLDVHLRQCAISGQKYATTTVVSVVSKYAKYIRISIEDMYSKCSGLLGMCSWWLAWYVFMYVKSRRHV